MGLFLRPLGEGDDPGGDLDDEDDEADSEDEEQATQLTGVAVVRGGRWRARSRCTSRNSTGSGSMYSAMMSAALALNDQSLRGHIAFRAEMA
jgi:hypothetical protein